MRGRTKILVALLATSVLVAAVFFSRGWWSAALDRWAVERAEHAMSEHEVQHYVMRQALARREFENTWLGVKVLQFPGDLLLYEELIHETRPDFIIEAGTYFGGLTLYLAMVLAQTNERGRIFTIDIEPLFEKTLQTTTISEELRNRITFIEGSSISAEVFDPIAQEVRGRNTLIILDTLHERDHVLRELRLWSELVPINGYLIVNDTHFDWHRPDPPGPLAAVREFLAENHDFVADSGRERYMISCSHSGILKRIR